MSKKSITLPIASIALSVMLLAVMLLAYPWASVQASGSVSVGSYNVLLLPVEIDAGITYPPEVNTDYDKLCAIYNLIEQMRLEHNRVGAVARADWREYKSKFRQYQRLYKEKQKLVLHEKNTLEDRLGITKYST